MNFTISKQPSDVQMEVANRWKTQRKKNGYTQQEAAERSGVSLGSLKRFEQTGEISFGSLLLLANLTENLLDFDSLFTPQTEIDGNVRKLFE